MDCLRFAGEKNHRIYILLPLIILAAAFNASAADITLAWDANTETDLAGYKIYYGTASRNYTTSEDVGDTTSYTITNLDEGVTYYFAAKAYDTSQNESDYSAELVHTISLPNRSPDIPQDPSGATSGYPNTDYSFSTAGSDPDGDALQYRFAWGDGNTSDWGASSQTHSWSSTGTFCVKAQALDAHSAASDWSACLNISIAAQTHTITASADPNGRIEPAGTLTVPRGSDQTFSIQPDPNYHVLGVLVDNNPLGVADTYTFYNVTQDHAIRVLFAADNQIPVSHAGTDQSVFVNTAVHLDGSGSGDPDGDTLSYQWSFYSVPTGSSAALSSTTVVNPNFVVDAAGTYIVQLIVNDGTVNSAPDTVTISTENSAPVADAGADQAVLVNGTVQLDGSGSSDVDGNSLTFGWSLVSKPAASQAALSDAQAVKPTFVVDEAGSYTVQLVVNDGTVSSAPDTVTISTENSAPVADAGADQTVLVNDTVQLDGAGSSDVDGDTLTFAWSFVSRPVGSTATLSDPTAVRPNYIVDVTGTYTLQLIVNDGTVNSTPDTVTISTDNSAPVADAGVDQLARINDTVQLDGDGSSDADGDTLTFKWSVIVRPGGSTEKLSSTTDRKPTFRVDAAGTYTLQLIVNDGTDYSAPDTVTIITENAPPVSNAGNDQTVEEGYTVTLSGLNSMDPDDNIASYLWVQTGGVSATLSNPNGAETTFVAPVLATDSETLTFQLTVQDTDGLLDVDTCNITVIRITEVDSDGDGVPDSQDAFPNDPAESLDTDGDGEGNNADTDDDNDGMPDIWELEYGLNPLEDDAADDPDGDEISNISEYNLGTQPNHFEGNLEPQTPAILAPANNALVGLTPLLETGDFNDPNFNDVHSKTQWKISRAFDGVCVFDVTSDVSLTSMAIPKQILEEDTEYIWQVRFFDNHEASSGWSEERAFITDIALNDSDGNGVPDDQEVPGTLDLDGDGTIDIEQSDIKCVSVEDGTTQICVSIRDAENAVSLISLEAEDPDSPGLVSKVKGKPTYIEFGLIDFKLLVTHPGAETTVTIFLSKPAYKKGICFKYDPVNDLWLDYTDYTQFSLNRKEVYLTLKDGGFGDADGIANGIIVDPLTFGSETDPNSDSSDLPIEEVVDGIGDLLPTEISCFIGTAAGEFGRYKLNAARPPQPGVVLSVIFLVFFLSYGSKNLLSRWTKAAGKGLHKQKPAADSPGVIGC